MSPRCCIQSLKVFGLLVPEKQILKGCLNIYGHGGHFDHVTCNIRINIRFPRPKEASMKFGFNRPSGFGGEDV